ncbi:hypothetical protein [Actinoplanes derwentensis]|uniref:Uncharacterized protein n=1 Tax=Actinoplanes derwentensis TaxID=113562 RepID=A0A1H1TZI8_9ACTN|nr:hypothetical protein [Actinoplanes derwentensis]SDS65648.1 hypothetical protein SAMN04489716_1287 [Actinoplanes derwentensis]
MTQPKKRPRLMTVDGVVYRWRIRRRPAMRGPLAFAIERADRRGTVLLAAVPTDGATPPPVPVLVAAVIRQARASGWRPDSPGPAFPLTVDPRAWAH